MNKSNVVATIPIIDGMTIYMPDAKSFYEVKEKLDEAGFEMQCSDDIYSVYIISAPYGWEYKETIYRIK